MQPAEAGFASVEAVSNRPPPTVGCAHLLEALQKLPETLQQEVLHYAEFLAQKYPQDLTTTELPQKKREAGALKGTFVLPLSNDFDRPLEDFKD